MATDKWLSFNGVEIVNLARTAQLGEALGIESVWLPDDSTDWIEEAVGGLPYADIASAPWYDPDFPASAEFAGVVPLGFPGLDDSTAQASTVEYVTAGGRSGQVRNATLPIVASISLVASTDRGADFGKRWLDRVLRGPVSKRGACSGVDLRYYRYPSADAPVAHRRQVRLTRGTSVTRKRSMDCSTVWMATFTLTCDDPYEYGEHVDSVSGLGTSTPSGALQTGSLDMTNQSCPAYDYTPVYDPLYPALVPSPTAPNLLPEGWAISEDMVFKRYWARVEAPEPSLLLMVPFITLATDLDTRSVRVSIWSSDSSTNDQCDPLFSVVVTYLPGGSNGIFYIDGEQQAAYLWDGFSPVVRRTDSLIYSPEAKPVEWAAFNDPNSLLVTLDVFDPDPPEIEVSLAFVPKSD